MSVDPMIAIVESALALPIEEAFEALDRALTAMPKLRHKVSGASIRTQESVAAALRAPPSDSRFALCMIIDFAHDPDAADARLEAFYDRYAANPTVPSREAHWLRSFAGLFRQGDTLLADLERQRALPPRPAPPTLVALEEKALALTEDVALEVLERAMASLGDRNRYSIELYAEILREPALLHAAMAARQHAVFRVLAMIVAYVHDPQGTRPALARIVEECSGETAEAYVYAKPWAELLPTSKARMVTLPEIVDEIIAAKSLVNQNLDWLPELKTTEQCRALVETYADRMIEDRGLAQLVGYGLRRLPDVPAFLPLYVHVLRVATAHLGSHEVVAHTRSSVLQKLARIDHDDARNALATLIERPAPRDEYVEGMVIDAAVRLGIHELARLRTIVEWGGSKALYVIAREAQRTGAIVEAPAAWAEFAVPYAMKAPEAAGAVLELLPKKEVARVVERLAPPKHYPAIAAEPRWLARYQAGAHVEVWSEMVGAGPKAHAHPEAAAVAHLTMERVRDNLGVLAKRLTKNGYPNKLQTRPIANLDATIASIEKLARVPVPLSLRAYWEVVGTVDFRAQPSHRSFAARWAEWEALDPLQTWEPKITLRHLRAAPPEKPIIASLRPPVSFPIGLDAVGKVDEENFESLLSVVVDGAAVDGVMTGAGQPTFVQYLRVAVARGGFLAIDDDEHADWNVAAERALIAFPIVAF